MRIQIQMITIRSHQPRVEFCFANYRYVSLECVRIHHECFFSDIHDRLETPCFIHCIFSSFCLQITKTKSIYIKHDVKAIPWEIFLIEDKNTTKNMQNSIHLSTMCVSSRILYEPNAKYDSRGYASLEHTKCRRIGICMFICTLAKPLYYLSRDYCFSLLHYNHAHTLTTKLVPTTCLVKQLCCLLLIAT